MSEINNFGVTRWKGLRIEFQSEINGSSSERHYSHLFNSSKQLPHLSLGPLKGFLSWHGAIHGHLLRLVRYFQTCRFTRFTWTVKWGSWTPSRTTNCLVDCVFVKPHFFTMIPDSKKLKQKNWVVYQTWSVAPDPPPTKALRTSFLVWHSTSFKNPLSFSEDVTALYKSLLSSFLLPSSSAMSRGLPENQSSWL